jgi:hypothetical protein
MFDVKEVVAVLDTHMPQELEHIDGVTRVNWLQRGTLFDFDCLEIVQAKERDVEELCMQVHNDTDTFRLRRYRRMHCAVDPQCSLSQSALNMLKSRFGKVEVRAIRSRDERMETQP